MSATTSTTERPGFGDGTAVAGAVVADETEAALAPELVVGRIAEAASGRPVVLHDDVPLRIALVVDVQRPAVARG